MDTQTPLQRAKEAAGSAAKLARAIGVTPQALSQWDECPPMRVLAVEAAAKGRVSRYELRPDIYGPPPDAGATTQAG
jgi:DNA-binding transcriptional regulator YdaS (Cro superfamily)